MGILEKFKTLYIGETGRRLGDRFREHLRDVEKDDQNASKPVARHFNLPNHSNQHMVVCGLSLHQGSTESRKTLEQKFIFQIGTLNPNGVDVVIVVNPYKYLAKLQSTGPLIYVSLKQKSAYCVILLCSKDFDTCKTGGPRLPCILPTFATRMLEGQYTC